jgi:anti-sigma regulatory factor (Ser/Thr protein kinase)
MSRVFEFSIEADLENLKEVRSFIESSGNALGVISDTLGDLCLVVDEAVTNIILHGYDGRDGNVHVQMERDGDSVIISIRDTAKSFGAADVETPHLETSLREREFGGMGVFLIRKLTDVAEFRSLPGQGNELRLVKHGAFSNYQR